MADRKVVAEWLERAKEDFEFASANLRDPKTGYFGPICFHFQQAAEKYLKAFIVAKGLKFEKIHDLDSLRQICVASNASFVSLEEACIFLSDFYLEARYPLIVPVEITREDAEKALQAAETIKTLIGESLEPKPSASP